MSYKPVTEEEIRLAIQGSNQFLEHFPHAIQARVLLHLIDQLEKMQGYADHLPECNLRYGFPEERRSCTCGFSALAATIVVA